MRKVMIDKEIVEKLNSIQRSYDFHKEIGGIIIGIFDTKGMCLRITDLSFPHAHDNSSRFRFVRHSDGHQKFMDEVWEQSNHIKSYLGEWHTHDQDFPVPSLVDKQTWKRISKRDNNFDQSVFIIIGRIKIRLWIATDGKIYEQEELLYE